MRLAVKHVLKKSHLYKTSGMAATLAGMDRVAFIAELPRFGVALMDLTNDDVMDDIANA